MLIVKLQGGLGNQLFQYAAGRRLSLLHQSTLKLDLSWFERHRSRRYALGAFNVLETFATKEEVDKIKGTFKRETSRFAFRFRQKMKPYYRRSIFAEPHLRPYDPNIEKTPKDLYLEGYWQSEKYFRDIQDTIRREFTIVHEPDYQNQKLAEQIIGSESVSIHVRRGDYIVESGLNRVHSPCGLDYYARCVNFMKEKVTNPVFFVFSDDPPWVRENMRLEFPTVYVTQNGPEKNYEDLRLMSVCKHNIIANSSFSWWAAWLKSNPNKIVLAPMEWFNDPTLDTRDLLPENWVKL